MKCFACGNELDSYSKCTCCYDKLGAERDRLRELSTIRERKIELQAKEIELLKKLLAGFQNKPRSDSGQDKWPVGCHNPEKDRVDLETEDYPHYDELIRRP